MISYLLAAEVAANGFFQAGANGLAGDGLEVGCGEDAVDDACIVRLLLGAHCEALE